jgi:hypothetical protein
MNPVMIVPVLILAVSVGLILIGIVSDIEEHCTRPEENTLYLDAGARPIKRSETDMAYLTEHDLNEVERRLR